MALSCLTWNSGKPCIYLDFKNNSCCDSVDYVHVETKRPVCRYHPQSVEMQTSESAELAATDSQQIKPKMPSLQEFLKFALNDVDGYKTNEEVYNYFARHFGR